jgi:nucleotide-binding universal stress UspA family protein
MQMIVVAVDWSEHSERAVELASDMASKYGAKLVAVHVIPDKPVPPDERHLAEIEFADEIKKYPGSGLTAKSLEGTSLEMRHVLSEHESKDQALRSIIGDKLLKRVKHTARRKGVENVETVRAEGNVVDAIVKTAKERKADLIVVGSRGMGALGEMFLGSVSHKVNQLSDISVVTVK